MRCDTSKLKIRQSWLLDIYTLFSPQRVGGAITVTYVKTNYVKTNFTFASSEFIKCSSDFKSLAEAKTLVSSANILKHNFSEQFGKSFMYIKNKRGPNVLPCGMPHNIVCSGI